MGTTQQCIKSRRKVEELQGAARPAELAIHEGSHKAHKPQRKPLVVYVVSPEVIHAEAGEFMALVQRLTGLEHSSSSPAAAAAAAAASCLRVPPLSSSEVKRAPQFPMRVKARAVNHSGEALRLTEPSSRSTSSVWSAWSGAGGVQEGGATSGGWLAREDLEGWGRFLAPNLGN